MRQSYSCRTVEVPIGLNVRLRKGCRTCQADKTEQVSDALAYNIVSCRDKRNKKYKAKSSGMFNTGR
jgi:hypothetical protein